MECEIETLEADLAAQGGAGSSRRGEIDPRDAGTDAQVDVRACSRRKIESRDDEIAAQQEQPDPRSLAKCPGSHGPGAGFDEIIPPPREIEDGNGA